MLHQFKVGDKVRIKGKDDIFTIAEVYGTYFYSFDTEEVAHLYIEEPNYENFYFSGDLEPLSI